MQDFQLLTSHQTFQNRYVFFSEIFPTHCIFHLNSSLKYVSTSSSLSSFFSFSFSSSPSYFLLSISKTSSCFFQYFFTCTESVFYFIWVIYLSKLRAVPPFTLLALDSLFLNYCLSFNILHEIYSFVSIFSLNIMSFHSFLSALTSMFAKKNYSFVIHSFPFLCFLYIISFFRNYLNYFVKWLIYFKYFLFCFYCVSEYSLWYLFHNPVVLSSILLLGISSVFCHSPD